MRIWKQLLLSLIVLSGALCLSVFLVPGAGDMLARMGVPQSLVSAIRPEAGAETVIRRWADFPAVAAALSEWSDA